MQSVGGVERESAQPRNSLMHDHLAFFVDNLADCRNFRIYLRSQLQWMEYNHQANLEQCPVS